MLLRLVTCVKKPDIVVFILDVTIVDVVSTGGAVGVTTGQVTGLEVVVVVTVTAAVVAGVVICIGVSSID